MSVRMLSSLEIDIPNRDAIKEAVEYLAEGYDVFSVTLEPGASDVELDLQPGALSDVHLFAIKANDYGSPAEISYKVHDAGNPAITLDCMQIFTGVGAVSLLGAQPDKIYLSNTGSNHKVITVAVARDATP